MVYRAAINTIVTNVIGAGLRPKPKVTGVDGRPAAEINRALEKAWWKYSRRDEWDARKKMPFVGEGQRLALKTILVSGDYILNAVASRPGAFLPVMWQQCEIDRLDTSSDSFKRDTWASENIKQSLHGINFDEFGAPVSYKFKGVDVPVSAKNIIHSYMIDRPEQYAGVPAAAAALLSSYTRNNIIEDYSLKSEAIARILWHLSLDNIDSPGEDDTDSDSVLDIPQMAQMRGEKAPEQLKFPDNVNDTVGAVVRMLIDGLCSTLGTSYTTVTRNMDGVNFAASKFIDIQEWRSYGILRDYIIDDAFNPFWEKFVIQMVVKGEIPGVSPALFAKDPYRFFEVLWMGNGKQDVDPMKDISADNEALRTGVKSFSQVIAERGGDVEEVIEQIREDRERMRSAGLEDLITTQNQQTVVREEKEPAEQEKEKDVKIKENEQEVYEKNMV
jgi:lambda family phage portal protein